MLHSYATLIDFPIRLNTAQACSDAKQPNTTIKSTKGAVLKVSFFRLSIPANTTTASTGSTGPKTTPKASNALKKVPPYLANISESDVPMLSAVAYSQSVTKRTGTHNATGIAGFTTSRMPEMPATLRFSSYS